MGKLVSQERTVAAASQFIGTEFGAAPPSRGGALILREINIRMGNESKTWEVRKVNASGDVLAVVQQSVDPATGLPAANTDTDVIMNGPEFATILELGEQVQIVTVGATAAMRAKIYYEEEVFQ